MDWKREWLVEKSVETNLKWSNSSSPSIDEPSYNMTKFGKWWDLWDDMIFMMRFMRFMVKWDQNNLNQCGKCHQVEKIPDYVWNKKRDHDKVEKHELIIKYILSSYHLFLSLYLPSSSHQPSSSLISPGSTSLQFLIQYLLQEQS